MYACQQRHVASLIDRLAGLLRSRKDCSTLEVISVCSHVSIQVATLRESSITDLALVRLFSSVRSVVFSKR